MSKLNELIEKYCPDGVDWKVLCDVCDIHKGVQFNKTDMKKVGTYPVINGGINPSGYTEVFNEDENTITISQGGASAGYVNFLKSKFWLGAHCYAVIPYDIVLNKYLYHFIKMNEITLQQCQYGAGIPALAKSTISSLEIPVPPIPVQEEIVRILDTFTELQAELQAELLARQEQYEYYRNKLLSFNEIGGGKWITLSEIGNVCMCKRIMKDQTNSLMGVPFYKIGTFGKVADAYISRELFEEYKESYSFPLKGEILISASGTIGRTVIYDGEDAYFQDSNIVWIHNDERFVLNKYLYYYYQIVDWNVEGGTIKRLYNNSLSKTLIAVPPILEQKRIVSILDKFDALVNDLSHGLPAEIAAVQEQYKYYRNKLLSFPKYKLTA